jgi:hypothetical protein
MSATYTIDLKRGIVLSKAVGKLLGADLLENLTRLSADPDFRSDLNQMADFREVTALEISTDDMKELAAKTPFGAGSRRAIVVNSQLAYGLSKIYRSMVEGESTEIKVFKDYSQACQWLGISPEAA